MCPSRGNPLVGVVEEPLELFSAEGPPGGVALVVGDVIGGVPVVADLARVLTEALLALEDPSIATVTGKVAEHRHRVLIGRDRRAGPSRRAQRHRPLLDVDRAPPPRVLTGEGLEATECLVAAVDGRGGQQTALLLLTPTGEDRLEHRRFRMQKCRPLNKHQARRSC